MPLDTKNSLPIDVLRELERIEAIPANARDAKDTAFYNARAGVLHTDRTILHDDKVEILKEQEENEAITVQELLSIPYWNDVRVPVTSTNLGGTKDPTFEKFKDNGAGSQGVFGYFFDAGIEEELYFMVQLPHNYIEGSDIKAHVHWVPKTSGAGNVGWGLEYTVAGMGETFGNTAIITGVGATGSTAGKHNITELGTIDGSGLKISDMLICRVFRDATAGADTYTGDAGLLEIDFHIKETVRGSLTEYSKE